MKKSKVLTICFPLLFTVGCVSFPPDTDERLGQFTAASSFDIRNLDYDKSKNTSAFVVGKSCYRVNSVSLAYEEGPKDNSIQRAMDDAIRNGQVKGIDGDLLVNVRIEKKTEHRQESFFTRHRYECIFVSGDLVRIRS